MSRLVVRLPNHLGDACMALPTLEHLSAHGFDLTLVGRDWAHRLFEAHPWSVATLSGGWPARVAALRAIRRSSAADARGLLLTNSFGTALEFGLAGLRTTGYAADARSWLLADPVPLPGRADNPREVEVHMVEYYFRLGERLAGAAPLPDQLNLRVSDRARAQARELCNIAGVASDAVVLCPAAVGLHRGQVKAWDGFGRLSADLVARGLPVVACPGPGEREVVVSAVPTATILQSTDVASFAALLAASRLVVANDSGAGHLAAAVGARLVSLFGVTEPTRTRPWGRRVRVVGDVMRGGRAGWPSYEAVIGAVDAALAE